MSSDIYLTIKDLGDEKREQYLDDCVSLWGVFKLQITQDEIDYLQWIGSRYEVTDLLNRNLHEGDLVSIDCEAISDALRADSIDRLPCCSEDSDLNQIVWRIGPELYE